MQQLTKIVIKMKIVLKFVFFSILLISCKSDNFYDTQRIIETDKTEYSPGDVINLTLKIIPTKSQKEIKIFDNYKNLEISFALVNTSANIYNEKWSEHSGNFLNETEIKTITISKLKPFVKTFKGYIIDKKSNVELFFPELQTKATFRKESLKNDSLRIHGFCNPINPEFGASLEEFFEAKDIKINIE